MTAPSTPAALVDDAMVERALDIWFGTPCKLEEMRAEGLNFEHRMRAALESVAAAIARPAAGWVLVPAQATEAMRSAFTISAGDTRILGGSEQFRIAYTKMLAASPSPPAGAQS